jgi:hypothetical protein
MKKILLVALFLASQTIFANSNPQMRTCRINLGQFWTVNIENPKTDNIGFCRFGNEMVDSITFMNYAFTNTPSNSLEAFLATEDFNFYSCAGAGAQKISSQDSYGHKADLCVFMDYSFIKESTLLKGWNHSDNQELSQALLNM